MTRNAHSAPEDLPTEVFDWGAIKWGVTPSRQDGAPLTVGEVVVNPTQGHDLHTHPDADEVLFFLEGSGVQTVGDSGPIAVQAGDFIYVPRGVVHSTFNTGWSQLRFIAIYTPGGAEEALRGAPDYAQLAPGAVPVWTRGD